MFDLHIGIDYSGRETPVSRTSALQVYSASKEGTEQGKELLLWTPMRRFGSIPELAGAAILLASDAATFITGHCILVDGGFLASGVNQ